MARKANGAGAAKAPTATERTAAEQLAFALQLRPPRAPGSEHARERRYQAERDLLVAVLSRIWPSHIAPAGQSKLVWSEVVCIHSPAGKLAWGLPIDRAHWFAHLARTANDWDGHSAGERDRRLRALLTLKTLTSTTPRRKPRRARSRVKE